MLIHIWMIPWSWCVFLSAGKRARTLLCSLVVHLGLHSNFSRSELCHYLHFSFFGLFCDIMKISLSLPSDKLLEIQQLAHSLLQRQPVAVHQAMSFLGKAIFCANGLAQLCQLCSVIQSSMLNVYHSSVHFCFISFIQHQGSISFGDCLTCSRIQSLCNFLFLVWVSLHMLNLIIRPFIFRILGSLYSVLEPGQVLSAKFILPCKNSRLLH